MNIKTFVDCKVPIVSFINFDDIELTALDQLKNCASLPFSYNRVVALPDIHAGKGISIGTVLATKDVVIPNAVGVDIGCGMHAVKTNLKKVRNLKMVMGDIRKAIPVGFKRHGEPQDEYLMPAIGQIKTTVVECEYKSALYQLGTLGGGNHFIEIQKDEEGFIWIMIHSGSRNLGKQVADYYNKIAVENNELWFSNIPKNYQLAFLPIKSDEGFRYLEEMRYCVDFALANRRLMMSKICGIMFDYNTDFYSHGTINIAHNYVQLENHFGSNVMVHRKGATLARKDTIGIIPGSQGSKSYIVRGLGNPESFQSCSHGAGRKMSRTRAQNELSLDEEIKKLDEMGIVHSIRGKKDLDEAPGAYKDIDEVMEQQKDLVEIVHTLTPIAVIKG